LGVGVVSIVPPPLNFGKYCAVMSVRVLRQRVWGVAGLSGSFGKFGAGDEGTFFGFFEFFDSL
jgi:hypothetical protein